MTKGETEISPSQQLANTQRLLVKLIALLVFTNGLLAIFRPLSERLPERIESLLAVANYEYFARSLDIFLGITLIYFSYQLLQRKLVAWWIAFISSILIALAHITTAHSLQSALLPLGSALILIVAKDHFKSRSEPSELRQGMIALVGSITVAIGYGTLGFWLMRRRDFGFDFSFGQALIRTMRAYLLIGNSDLHPHSRHARWFIDSLNLLGASSLLYGVYSLFRPLEYRFRVLPEERLKADRLIKQFSQTSEDFFKVWPLDKSYFFASDQKAVVAYGVKGGMALAVGDPVGEIGSIRLLLPEFEEYCIRNGWSPAFIYVSERLLNIYQNYGFSTIKVGEDALVNLTYFSEETANNKHFRHINNRFTKEGLSVERHLPPHSKQLLQQMSATSKDWLRLPEKKEWRFLAGSYSNGYMGMGPVYTASNQAGKVQAFANQIPSFAPGQATIDLMRHRRNATSGIMDFLLRGIMLELGQAGYREFNLGLAPLSGLDVSGKPEEKLLNLIYQSNQSFISFQGLRQFKSKFEPEWQPKYVAYLGGPARLPWIAYALNKIMTVD